MIVLFYIILYNVIKVNVITQQNIRYFFLLYSGIPTLLRFNIK